jgi:RNA polymerase sigma factor (sigma-70 family)
MSPTSPSDEQLMAAFYGGCDSAFAQLVERHHDRLRTFFRGSRRRRGTAGQEDRDEDDLAQTVWDRVVSSRSRTSARFDPGRGSFEAWLWTLARYVLLDAARRPARRRRQEVPVRITARLSPTIADPGQPDPLVVLAFKDLLEAVRRRLDEPERIVLDLLAEGLTQREIAQALGWSDAKVSKLKPAIEEALQAVYGEKNPRPGL